MPAPEERRGSPDVNGEDATSDQHIASHALFSVFSKRETDWLPLEQTPHKTDNPPRGFPSLDQGEILRSYDENFHQSRLGLPPCHVT